MVSWTENKKITEVVLVHHSIVNNSESCIIYSKKEIGQLLDTSPKQNHIFQENWFRFSFSVAWFPGQNSKPLEIEEKNKYNINQCTIF